MMNKTEVIHPLIELKFIWIGLAKENTFQVVSILKKNKVYKGLCIRERYYRQDMRIWVLNGHLIEWDRRAIRRFREAAFQAEENCKPRVWELSKCYTENCKRMHTKLSGDSLQNNLWRVYFVFLTFFLAEANLTLYFINNCLNLLQ